MSRNSSSSFDPNQSIYLACQASVAARTTNTMFSLFSTFLLLPVYTLVLHIGFHRWRRQRSGAAGAKMSHTDFFTYVMMILEMFGVLASILYMFSLYIENEIVFMFGMSLYNFTLSSQTFVHVLTCMERYLAVVHPIIYVQFRELLRIRTRTLSTVGVWLLSFGWVGLTVFYLPQFPTAAFFTILGICISAMFYFCLSVLHVLTRSGPGRADKDRVDQSKQRAFHMIVAITGALLLRFVGLLFVLGLSGLQHVDLELWCPVMDSGMWMTVPSSLVLPVLFLHRAGKLSCCRKQAGPFCLTF